jgi:predicted molibdopterin-dependent oxidoreductase YjgC
MPPEPLFRPLEAGTVVTIELDGERLRVPAGVSLAAALLASGLRRARTTPVSGAPRAPYCMMGACFDCLMEVDGAPSQQTCRIAVADGMRVRTQQGARDVHEPDHGR